MTLADLIASPDHYLQRFEGRDAVFVPMDRAAYHRSIFLDARIDPAAPRDMRVPAAMLLPAAPPALPSAWIFHVAHCGSTLLARALDALDGALVLREPQALRQLAIDPDDAGLRLVLGMTTRRYRADAPTLVKANVPVNFLLPRMWPVLGEARAILLYLPLRDYLLAILRSDQHRDWLRRVTTQLAPHLGVLDGRSDAHRAATLWTAQMRAFADAIASRPNDVRSLDAEAFFADPAPVLIAAATHLRLPLDQATIAQIVAGPLFATYSKNPTVAFDNDARLARRAELEHALAAELAEAQDVAEAHGDDAAVRTVTGAALDVG